MKLLRKYRDDELIVLDRGKAAMIFNEDGSVELVLPPMKASDKVSQGVLNVLLCAVMMGESPGGEELREHAGRILVDGEGFEPPTSTV
jgi:hypothetical protein